MKNTLLFFSLFITSGLLLTACPGSKTREALKSTPPAGWMVPVEVADTPHATQEDYYRFGWESFVALSWPADTAYRGMPDSTLPIGANDTAGNQLPAVWESWKEQYDVFLPNARNPGPWNYTAANRPQEIKLLRRFAKNDSSEVLDAFDEATGAPLIDQDSQFVRYEVRTNESEYTYYSKYAYYDADSQVTAVQQNRFVGFPKGGDSLSNSLGYWARYGATEVKASWRIFKPGTPDSIKNRYFHKQAMLINQYGVKGKLVDIGLVGLHILRLTPSTGSTWYWASFEQVDNLVLHPSYGGKLPTHPTFNTQPPQTYASTGYSYQPAQVSPGQPLPKAIPVNVSSPPFLRNDTLAALAAINKQYSQRMKGTPFAFYQLIGTVNPPVQQSFTDSSQGYPSVQVNTPWLANSTMETYIVQSNCVTCHIAGFPQLPEGFTPNSSLQVFTFLPSMAQSSSKRALKKIFFRHQNNTRTTPF